ncbi:MAG: TonB-dependent receptor plug domain-containing protein [Pseudomonadota bacterium]
MNWQHTMMVAGVALVGVKGVQAAEFDPQGAEAAYFDELPTVVSAGRMEQSLTRAPASVTVIDREMIEASGRTSLPDLMRLAAGFQVGHQGGFWVGVTRHGVSEEFARRLQVLVDGRTVYLPGTAGVDWHDLPVALEEIERIEVTRGPNGASYGANAYQGTIHIRTREPGTRPGTTVRVDAGEHAYRRTLVSHDARGEHLDQRLTWHHQEDEGYPGEDEGARHDQHRHKINYRGRLRPGVNDYVDVMGGLTAGEWGSGTEGDVFRPAREAEVERYYGQLAWQRLFSTREELRARLHVERSDTDLVADLPPLTELDERLAGFRGTRGDSDAPLRLDESRDIRRVEAEVEYHHQPVRALRLIWGAQSRRDTMAAAGYFGDGDTRTLEHNRMFGHAEWRLASAWTLHGGTGVERESYTGTNWAPRAALNWHYRADHAVRLGTTRAWRTPGFVDSEADWGHRFTDNNEALHYIARGNDELEPERIDSVELAAVGQTPALNYEVKLFQQRLVDVVTGVMTYYDEQTDNTPYYPTFCDPEHNAELCREARRLLLLENDGTITQRGLETQLDWRPLERTRLGLGYAYVRADGELTEKVKADGSTVQWDAEELTPDHTLSVLLNQRWGAWRAGVGIHHVSEMDWISADPPAAFTTADFSLARDMSLGWGTGEIRLAVLDGAGSYSSFRERYEHERRVYLRLGLKL